MTFTAKPYKAVLWQVTNWIVRDVRSLTGLSSVVILLTEAYLPCEINTNANCLDQLDYNQTWL